MQNIGKVVPLNATSVDGAPSTARLPVVLLQVRDKSAQQLKEWLQALFDNADDTLFEMADRARSNSEQNLFFEAMRDIRLKRKGMERGFLDMFFESFLRLGQPQRTDLPLPEPVSFDKLALVHNDDLERTVAIDSMVTKVVNRDGVALTQLTTRLNVLLPHALTDDSNPLGPTLLCDVFLKAGRALGVDIKVKLIVLKLFENYVLRNTERLYTEANQLLIDAGVLPDLKLQPTRRASDRSTQVADGQEEVPLVQAAEKLDNSVREVFGALQELLVHVRGSLGPSTRNRSDARAISSQDLMRLLSHLQRYVPTDDEQGDADFRVQLEQLIARVNARSGKVRVVGGVDEDVINLISMLFDFILDDRNLPASMRALIGRLQIPMLKVAVLDKSFFSRGTHPARRLLNEIAAAALGWGSRDDVQRDALYQRVNQIVQRLLDDFVDDISIFTELLVDFLAFTSDERRRSELLEQRTRDAEEGRAQSELARARVQDALNQRLFGRTLPEAVVRLLHDAWSKVLLLTCLKHGQDSAEWRASIATMDDLIWSVTLHEDPQARQRLLELVPGLLKALRDGLTSAAFDPFATSEFFGQLELLHLQAFQHLTRLENPGAEPSVLLGVENETPSMTCVAEEIVLKAHDQRGLEEPLVHLSEDDPGVREVDRLRLGAWVEIQEDLEQRLRCKLAAVVEPGRYVFVNRAGTKVLEKTRMSLAVEFSRGAIRVLDEGPLFDRALDAVMGQLYKLRG